MCQFYKKNILYYASKRTVIIRCLWTYTRTPTNAVMFTVSILKKNPENNQETYTSVELLLWMTLS